MSCNCRAESMGDLVVIPTQLDTVKDAASSAYQGAYQVGVAAAVLGIAYQIFSGKQIQARPKRGSRSKPRRRATR